MQKGRARQAFRETASAKNWQLRLLEAAAVLVVTYAGLTWYSPRDRVENIVLGLAAGAAVLGVVPLTEFVWHYVRLGRPIRELRHAISSQPAATGPGEISLRRVIEDAGVPFMSRHLVALRAIDADGDIQTIRYVIGFGELGATEITDASIVPVADRFTRD